MDEEVRKARRRLRYALDRLEVNSPQTAYLAEKAVKALGSLLQHERNHVKRLEAELAWWQEGKELYGQVCDIRLSPSLARTLAQPRSRIVDG